MFNIEIPAEWLLLGRAGERGPKLSEYLIGLGVPETIAGACGRINTRVTNDPEDIREQAVSSHYLSCLAADEAGKAMIEEDVRMAEAGHLFLWVAGQRKSIDGEGFKARAKVRTLTDAADQVKGIYVEPVYGNHMALWNAMDQLEAWAADKYGRYVPIMMFGSGTELYCPSAAAGKQDTQQLRLKGVGPHQFEPFSFEKIVQRFMTEKGCALADIVFNPQNGVLKLKK